MESLSSFTQDEQISALSKPFKAMNITPCNVPVKEKRKAQYDIKKEDLTLLFFSACSGRGNNDIYNDKREYILAHILTDKFKDYLDDPKWNLLRNGWKDILHTLFNKTSDKSYDTINVIKRGGRKFNYDFDIEYVKDSIVVNTVKNIEFKYGGSSISEIPQFFNAIANKSFLTGYAEWFYDTYVSKQDPWTRFEVPSKEIYMKEIYKNSSNHKFFINLKAAESDKDYYKVKQEKTAESIKVWLNENYESLKKDELSNEFIRTQDNKIFILWNKDMFNIDNFNKEDLKVSEIVGIKNNNTILINSESKKIQYAMLLRWKNQLGVLLPAWQISMKRLA